MGISRRGDGDGDGLACLCLRRYETTLHERVDPGHLSKRAFRESGRELVDGGIRASLAGVLEGIKHLHSLGLVYHDITQVNIMYDGNHRLWQLSADRGAVDGDEGWEDVQVVRSEG